MERAQNMIISPRIAIIIIIIFHIVGVAGLSIPALHPVFLQMVPWHIMLMLLMIILSHHPVNSRFWIFILITFWAGFFLEWIGVHKNWIFGSYAYGQTLGVKVLGIPLTIGVNWFLLVYAAGVTMQRSRLRSIYLRIITGALLLVVLDLLIEPVAIKFDYWHWTNNIIPLKNYLGWFLVSAAMLCLFEHFNFKKQSLAAPLLLITQFLFFAILNLIA